MNATNYKLANMNPVGKRTAISPVSKRKMILGSLLASYIVQLIGLSLLFIFTILGKKRENFLFSLYSTTVTGKYLTPHANASACEFIYTSILFP